MRFEHEVKKIIRARVRHIEKCLYELPVKQIDEILSYAERVVGAEGKKYWQKPEKRGLNTTVYAKLREQGRPDEDIMKQYGATHGQIGAYKAWVTMRTRKKETKKA